MEEDEAGADGEVSRFDVGEAAEEGLFCAWRGVRGGWEPGEEEGRDWGGEGVGLGAAEEGYEEDFGDFGG